MIRISVSASDADKYVNGQTIKYVKGTQLIRIPVSHVKKDVKTGAVYVSKSF